jgi:hypothetical protein
MADTRSNDMLSNVTCATNYKYPAPSLAWLHIPNSNIECSTSFCMMQAAGSSCDLKWWVELYAVMFSDKAEDFHPTQESIDMFHQHTPSI